MGGRRLDGLFWPSQYVSCRRRCVGVEGFPFRWSLALGIWLLLQVWWLPSTQIPQPSFTPIHTGILQSQLYTQNKDTHKHKDQQPPTALQSNFKPTFNSKHSNLITFMTPSLIPVSPSSCLRHKFSQEMQHTTQERNSLDNDFDCGWGLCCHCSANLVVKCHNTAIHM